MDAKNKANQLNAIMGFNPRARDGREALIDIITLRTQVSIHAPVMDANARD